MLTSIICVGEEGGRRVNNGTLLAMFALTCILEQTFIFSVCGTVLVTATDSMSEVLMRSTADPENIPCVIMAYTLLAPASFSLQMCVCVCVGGGGGQQGYN